MELSSGLIAEYAQSVSIDDLPAGVIEDANRLVLDSIGCCLGAYTSPPSKAARRSYGSYEPPGAGATVIGSGATVPVEYAALINATMVRYLDYNDAYVGHGGACHPSDHIPALLAVAEAEGATGADLIEAIVVAYEIEGAGRDTGALADTAFDYVTWGTYSSAASIGALMGLSRDELVDAIGIAGTSSSGLGIARQGEVSMWKGVAHPYVSHNAVQACQLARNGMTGPERVFEGDSGLFDALGGPVEIDGFGGSDHGDYRISRTNIKPFACGYYMQTMVEAIQSLVEEGGFGADDVDSVLVRAFDHAVGVLATPEKWETPMTRETADHSIPYTAAVTLVYGTAGPRQYDAEALEDGRVHDAMAKVEVEEDEELNRYREENPTEIPMAVRIEVDGETYEKRVDTPIGHEKRPMPDDQLEAKMTDMAREVLTDDQIERAIDRCYGLHQRDRVDDLLDALVI